MLSSVDGAIPFHIDGFVMLGSDGEALVPSGNVEVGAQAGGVVLAIADTAGVGVSGVRRAIELISAGPEEGDPSIIRVGVPGWRGGIDIEESDCCSLLNDLERGYFEAADYGVEDVLSGVVGVCSVVVLVDEIFESVEFISHDCSHQGRGNLCDCGVVCV